MTTFKAKIIDDQEYYKLRARNFWIALLVSFVLGTVSLVFDLPLKYSIPILVLYILLTIVFVRSSKRIFKLIGNKTIEISSKLVLVKSRKGKVLESINIDDVEAITITEELSIPQQSTADIADDALGNPKQNFISIHLNGEVKRFDLFIESHYMLVQIHKIVDSWMANGVQLIRK